MKPRRVMSFALAAALSLSIAVPAYAADDGGGGDITNKMLPNGIINEIDNAQSPSNKTDLGGKGLIDIIGGLIDHLKPPADAPSQPNDPEPTSPPSDNDPEDPGDPPAPPSQPNEDEEEPSNDEEKPPVKPSKPNHTRYSVDGLNFFVNLGGDVLDTTDSSGHYSSALFTSALTSQYSVDGEDLEDAVVESDYYGKIGTYYDAILGEDGEYADVDAEIRDILSDFITMPTDSAILSSIKNQISNGTKIYDINGELVSESLVSTDYYDVYWYVLKEGNSYWHVDGILEKKSQPTVNTYDVTYSWTFDCNVPGVKFPDITPPEKVTYAENDLVTPDYTYNIGHMISDPDDIGTWQFSGWSIRNPFNITEDTEITGEWRFTQHIPTPTPTPVQYSYQIVYTDANRSSIRSPESGTIEAGTDWDLTSKVPDTIVYNGITYNKSSVDGPLTGTNANANIVVTVVYLEAEEEPDPVQYMYQITYLNENGVEIYPMVSGYIDAGSDWDLLDKIPNELLYNGESYTVKEIIDEKDVYGESISSDITIVVKYKKQGGNPTPPTKTYSVRYEWTVNGGPGLPSTVTLPKGESHDRTFDFCCNGDYYKDLEVSVTGGKYVFSGWSDGRKSPATGTLIREPGEHIECTVEELVLRGTWEWVEDEVVPPTPPTKTYSVRYEWTVNGGPGLPSTVTLPEGESHDSTFCFSCDGRYKGLEVSVTGGKYVFSGWSDGRKSPATGTLIREPGEQIECTVEELVLRGTWEWVEDEVVPPTPPVQYDLTITYVDKHGTILGMKTGKINAGDDWNLSTYLPTTYSYWNLGPYTGEVDGENCSADVVVVATYYKMHRLIINYVDSDTGATLQTAYGNVLPDCSDWDLTDKIPSEIQYNNEVYTWVANEGGSLTGSDIHNGVIITAKYQKKSNPTPPPSTPSKVTYYKIEVEFVDANGNKISDDYITTVRKSYDYDVSGMIPYTIMVGDQEYTFKETTGDSLNGIANSNKEITAWYELKVIPEIPTPPEPPVPPEPPETPETPEPVITPEPPVVPEEPKPEEPKEELDNVPKTGDPGIGMYLMSALSSMAGILYLTRKKKDEE